jgi:hypothetical protein
MKTFFTTLFFFSAVIAFSQKLPDELNKQPDGITIHYFDYSDRNNLISSEVFLSEKLKFKFPAHKDYNRIDIAQKTAEIELIEKYLTGNLIDNIQKCCSLKNCPDTSKGYYFMIKKGNDIKYTYIDYNFMTLELCGSEDLKKIVDSFKNI